MNELENQLSEIFEPADFFKGRGKHHLPTPLNVLLFVRSSKSNLQQEALQNRSHHRFVLVLNLETSGYIHINNLAFAFHPGQALLIHPFQFHHYSHLSSMQLNWLFCTFELEPRTFLEPLRNRIIDVSPKTKQSYRALIDEWLTPRGELQTEQLQADLLQLLLSLKLDRLQTGSDLPPEPKDSLLLTINRQMAEWRGRTVTCADLADAVGYSESRLRVLFKETAGVPLGFYMQNYRINRAMALLQTSTLSISDIAEEAGFGSPQAFSRIFKKEAGVSPRSYRNKKE